MGAIQTVCAGRVCTKSPKFHRMEMRGYLQAQPKKSTVDKLSDSPNCRCGLDLKVSSRILLTRRPRLWATTNYKRGATFRFTLPARGVVVKETVLTVSVVDGCIAAIGKDILQPCSRSFTAQVKT